MANQSIESNMRMSHFKKMIKFHILNHVLRLLLKETRTEFWSIELDNGTIYLMTKQKILKLDNKLVNRFPVLSVHWFYISLACWRQIYLTCLVGNVFTFLIYLLVYSFVLWFFIMVKVWFWLTLSRQVAQNHDTYQLLWSSLWMIRYSSWHKLKSVT